MPRKKSSRNHGLSKLLEYNSWRTMKQRCTNKNANNYKNYGGRGITVCDRWLHSFDNFFEDMGERPTPKHSLDRIDNDGDYEPSNCRWATRIEQLLNRRPYSNNKSGFYGVSWSKERNKWEAGITRDGKTIHLGRYFTAEEASKEVQKKAAETRRKKREQNKQVEDLKF